MNLGVYKTKKFSRTAERLSVSEYGHVFSVSLKRNHPPFWWGLYGSQLWNPARNAETDVGGGTQKEMYLSLSLFQLPLSPYLVPQGFRAQIHSSEYRGVKWLRREADRFPSSSANNTPQAQGQLCLTLPYLYFLSVTLLSVRTVCWLHHGRSNSVVPDRHSSDLPLSSRVYFCSPRLTARPDHCALYIIRRSLRFVQGMLYCSRDEMTTFSLLWASGTRCPEVYLLKV
jgi:hypothetical protein